MCRILEIIIAKKITHYLLSNNLLSDSQFGFLPGRYACTQLLVALNIWYNSYHSGINISIVYSDIFKTFNTGSHRKLLSVLKSYGIANNTSNWICAFITGRCQCVCTNSTLYFLPITSDVMQGSVLGPLLLLISINNLTVSGHPKHAVSGMFLYADDAKLFSTDSTDLQQSLTGVNTWMEFYQLSFAQAKCQHLPIICHTDADYQYYIGMGNSEYRIRRIQIPKYPNPIGFG